MIGLNLLKELHPTEPYSTVFSIRALTLILSIYSPQLFVLVSCYHSIFILFGFIQF